MSRRQRKAASTGALRAERQRLASEIAALEARAAKLRAEVKLLRDGSLAMVDALERSDLSLAEAEIRARVAGTVEGRAVAQVAALLRRGIEALARAVGVEGLDDE